ncbi:MAG: ABC transporter permease [Fibrobacteres bacterium]|nr:ABC transporter permease [Fibrobacterota bacterium]
MKRYVLRRILQGIPIIFGVSLITFLLFNVVGGDPVYQLVGKGASAQEVEALRHELGLDRPLPAQYLHYLKQIITFDFGRSYATRQKISEMILDGIWPSLSLAIPSFVFGSLIAIAVAMLAACYRNRWPDRLILLFAVAGMSISIVVYIILGQYYLSYLKGLFPISGWEPGLSGLPYLVLPGLIWVTVSLGSDVRYFRTVFLDEMNQDFVTTAKAKGVSGFSVLFVHVLRNAMIPIITRLVMAIPFLYTGSLLLENFFGIPGLGSMSINAINSSDLPVIKAITFLGSLSYIAGNILTDVCYAAADPRIRLS